MSAAIRIGTSGWQYAHWRGDFYPRELPSERWLEFYTETFDTVELNTSFYRLPRAEAFDGWRRRVPSGFTFAVKASRYLTHIRRLQDPDEALGRLWSRARRLENRLGPVLYQLPPRWKPNIDRLASFLTRLPKHPQVVEFRDAAWYQPAVERLLEEAEVGLCLHDMAGSATAPRRVGPLVYVRFHGSGARYGGAYTPQRLSAWADRIAEWSAGGWPVWAYFNNDIGGHAPRDAARLRSLVARRA